MSAGSELIELALFGVFGGIFNIETIESFISALLECHDVMHDVELKILP